jgi:hypothetical protein
MLRVVLFLFPHSGHGTTFSQFKMHVPHTIRSRRFLFHPNHLGHITPLYTLLRNRDLVGALSIETHCTISFQNESNGGSFVVFNVARFVQ